MTRVLEVTLLETCLDSSTVKELAIDSPLTPAIMHAAAERGTLRYYPHFPKPYFRIERAHHYVVQGVIGNRTLRVTFSPSAGPDAERALCRAIEREGTG